MEVDLRASAVPSSSAAAPEIVCPLPEWREVARNGRGLFAGDPPRPICPNWMGVRNAVEEASIRFPPGEVRYTLLSTQIDSKTFARDAFYALERPHRMILRPQNHVANTAPFFQFIAVNHNNGSRCTRTAHVTKPHTAEVTW